MVFLLGNSRLRILEFPTMSSSGLTRGSLYGILEFFVMRSPDQVGDDKKHKSGNFIEIVWSSWTMTQVVRNSRIPRLLGVRFFVSMLFSGFDKLSNLSLLSYAF